MNTWTKGILQEAGPSNHLQGRTFKGTEYQYAYGSDECE